jgi:hypothetical protein
VIMDCDPPGRRVAHAIATDLGRAGAAPTIIDLAPRRCDGYDVSDWLVRDRNPVEALLGDRAHPPAGCAGRLELTRGGAAGPSARDVDQAAASIRRPAQVPAAPGSLARVVRLGGGGSGRWLAS